MNMQPILTTMTALPLIRVFAGAAPGLEAGYVPIVTR